MRHLRSFFAGLTSGLFFVAAGAMLLVPTLSLAQQPQFGMRNPVPRMLPWQAVHYIRFTVNFNSCTLVAGTCSVKVGAVPYNTAILRAWQQVTTAFNSGTTDTVALATTSGGAQLVAAQTVHAATAMTALTVVAANLGIAATGNGIAQTGAEGGFDIWAVYAQTGAAPTAGQAIYVLEYIPSNDGTCAPVPFGATAGAC